MTMNPRAFKISYLLLVDLTVIGFLVTCRGDLVGDGNELVHVYYDEDSPIKYFDSNGTTQSLVSEGSAILKLYFDSKKTSTTLSEGDTNIQAKLTKDSLSKNSNATIPSAINATYLLADEWSNTTRTSRKGDEITCGEANANGKSNQRLVSDRIIGGSKTEPGEFPFQVRLNIKSRRGSGICGGILIDKQYLLTAAHCITACITQNSTTVTIDKAGVNVTLGDHTIKSNDGEIEVDIESIIAHEKFNACSFVNTDHDIALMKLSEPVEYRFTVDGYGSINRPCMPRSSSVSYTDGEQVIVSGWGLTSDKGGRLSNVLRYVQVPVVNTKSCQKTYGSRVSDFGHICAGSQAGGKDSCQGDSGGPLVRVIENSRYELVGIVSFGFGCGQPGAPGVYTKVSNYVDWIREKMVANSI